MALPKMMFIPDSICISRQNMNSEGLALWPEFYSDSVCPVFEETALMACACL